MISTPPPDSLAISPTHIAHIVSAGSDAGVTVFNIGKGSDAVTVNLAQVARSSNGACQVRNGSVWGWTANPSAFTLKPGDHRAVTVHFTEPTAAEVKSHAAPVGMEDLAIFAAVQAGHSGNARVVAEVGAQALVSYPGKTPADAPKPCLAISEVTAPGGFPWPLVGGGAAALAALGAAGAYVLGWRRRRATR